jgi:hypothetical protein
LIHTAAMSARCQFSDMKLSTSRTPVLGSHDCLPFDLWAGCT